MNFGDANLGSCPVCSAPFEREKTAVIKETPEALTLHVDCPNCGSSTLVAIEARFRGLVTTVGLPTDFTKTDLKHLKRRQAISSDDVLRFHVLLKGADQKSRKI